MREILPIIARAQKIVKKYNKKRRVLSEELIYLRRQEADRA